MYVKKWGEILTRLQHEGSNPRNELLSASSERYVSSPSDSSSWTGMP